MGLSSTTILWIVELAIYAVLLPMILYIGYRHGRHGILGYFYLNIACVIRIAADIVDICDRNSPRPTVASTVVSAIGLTPLIFALAGFLHEIHRTLIGMTIVSPSKQKQIAGRLWFAQWWIHVVAITGMVLLIIGGIHLVTAEDSNQRDTDDKLRSAGALLLLLLWIPMVQYAAWLLYRSRRLQINGREALTNLSLWTLVGSLFIGVKLGYAVAYTFDHNGKTINPISGSLAVKAVLVVAMEILAVLSLIAGGGSSMSIGQGHTYESTRNSAEYRQDSITLVSKA